MTSLDRPVSISDYPALEKVSDLAIKDKQKFERLVVSKEKLLEMFAVCFDPSCPLYLLIGFVAFFQYNKYKVHIIQSKIPDGTSTTVYRCGPMVDLCVGPHIPHTGRIKAFMVTKVTFNHFCALLRSFTRTQYRAPPPISSVTPPTIPSREFMAYHSRRRSSSTSTRNSLPRRRNVITARSGRSRNYSSSTT